jgi:ketol-acid reductoisomerase
MNTLIKAKKHISFKNNSIFNKYNINKLYRNLNSQTIKLADTSEVVYKKNEYSDQFFESSLFNSNIKRIGVIGWGSQGEAQAMNLRDTINKLNLNIPVIIGLRENSNSKKEANNVGFEVDNIENVLSSCDLNLMLVSDSAQCNNFEKYFSYLKPQSTLGFSHGFLLGHLKNIGKDFPKNNNIIMVAPKGMGLTVRSEYLSGRGINSSVGVYNDVDENAKNLALSWAYGIGSPQIFETTMEKEYISDIFGERAILLGGLHGIVEYLYKHFMEIYSNGYAFNASVTYLVDDLSKEISNNGFLKLYNNMSKDEQELFNLYYSKSYIISKSLYKEIYEEVKSGNEIRSVNLNSHRNISNISGSKMWTQNKYTRKNINMLDNSTKSIVGGIYIGSMMAQVDILIENDHSYSEIVNESIIEAVDSLNPYMASFGISNMIDNCSITARLGARKWAPRLESLLNQNMDNIIKSNNNFFIDHKIHDIYKTIRTI